MGSYLPKYLPAAPGQCSSALRIRCPVELKAAVAWPLCFQVAKFLHKSAIVALVCEALIMEASGLGFQKNSCFI